MPAASLDQVYVTCPGCGHLAVSPPPRLAAKVQRATGYVLVVGSLMVAGAVLAIHAAL
jgi:hypothetical protein